MKCSQVLSPTHALTTALSAAQTDSCSPHKSSVHRVTRPPQITQPGGSHTGTRPRATPPGLPESLCHRLGGGGRWGTPLLPRAGPALLASPRPCPPGAPSGAAVPSERNPVQGLLPRSQCSQEQEAIARAGQDLKVVYFPTVTAVGN